MNKYNFKYWSNSTPSAKREPLPNGVFCLWNSDRSRRAVVHVQQHVVVKIELWKINRYGTWGKSEEDQIRLT